MKRIIKISIGLISTAIIFLVIAVLVFLFYLNPFLADGPFTGEARVDCNLLNSPVHVFPVGSVARVEVYGRKGDDPAPTVLLRDGANKIRWCVYPASDSFSEVYDIEFRRYGPWFILGTKVEGVVNWTYGHEWTGWYLGPLDGLLEYYYGW